MKISMNVRDFIESLSLHLNVTERFNCPSCGNYNTLSVTQKIGGTMWFCFHNSCKTQGRMGATITTDMLSKYFEEPANNIAFKPPDSWFDRSQVKKLLNKHNILDVYDDRRVNVGWDSDKERYVFLIWVDGTCVGGTGRSYTAVPKWLVYTPNKAPLVVPKFGTYYSPYHSPNDKKIGVVVEDAISAAAVSHVHDGIAILGTYIPDRYIPVLSSYDELIIALDEDATDKALMYQQMLNVFVPTKLIMLKQDLKDMHKDAIQDKLETVSVG